MKTIFKRCSVLFLCLMMVATSLVGSAYGMEENIQSFPGNLSNKVGENSSISVRFDLLKVSVYLGMNNNEEDFPRKADGSIDPAKVNFNKLAQFGESIFAKSEENLTSAPH